MFLLFLLILVIFSFLPEGLFSVAHIVSVRTFHGVALIFILAEILFYDLSLNLSLCIVIIYLLFYIISAILAMHTTLVACALVLRYVQIPIWLIFFLLVLSRAYSILLGQ